MTNLELPSWIKLPERYKPTRIIEFWEKPRIILIECKEQYELVYYPYEDNTFMVTTCVFYSEAVGMQDLGIYYNTIEKHLTACHELRGMQITPHTEHEEIVAFLALKALAR